jgi:hypothetical protein
MFNKNNITKISNLNNNDSLSSYLSFSSQQNHHCYEAFYTLIKKIKPKRILEIGTGIGGLTRYLKFISREIGLDLDILTFETNGRIEHKEMIKDGIDLRLKSIFQNKNTIDEEAVNFIQKEGITIVLCDGGNKIQEFNSIAKHIKQNDIIMAHDYSYDEETFKTKINKKYWNWFEISELNISEECEKNNLKPFLQETFEKAVWVCKIKE